MSPIKSWHSGIVVVDNHSDVAGLSEKVANGTVVICKTEAHFHLCEAGAIGANFDFVSRSTPGGLIPDDALASGGVPSTSTYLRGDRTWAAPSGASIPTGVIVMWSGLLVNIPSGWVLCNGLNGTPDLRDRFVVGAAAGADPGATGGSNTHTHAGHAVHVFTQAVNHVFTQALGHAAHVFTQPGVHSDHTGVITHTHVQRVNTGTTGALSGYTPDTSTSTSADSGYSVAAPAGAVASLAHTGHSGGAVDAHSPHSGSSVDPHSGAGVDAHSAHDSPDSRPPYYAIAFIMKT